jgi:quercetin dioxygenase-like cupin family protein
MNDPNAPAGPTLFYRHADAPLCRVNAGPLAGLRHRTVIDARTGAAQLALWQEEHEAGFHVPPHRHNCEEIISVLAGAIEAEVKGERFRVGPGESFLIPAWEAHGFRVLEGGPVRLLAIFSVSNPKIFRLDGFESSPPWEGGASDHLEESVSVEC